ncbi:MAG: hypothetical protein LBR08_01680 [Bacteroidales bacterium]|jgi:hypothetical protein|nr:hypothetical protein [Bacteroidales bacterium]
MELITTIYQKEIAFTLSCYDRLILTGSIPELSYAGGMTGYLYNKGVRIFDYPRFAEPVKEKIRANIEQKAHEQGVSIEFIRKSGERKYH